MSSEQKKRDHPKRVVSTQFIFDPIEFNALAGDAPATAVGAGADPAGSTSAAAPPSVACRELDDRSCVLEEGGGAAELALCTGLQAHRSQHQRRCSQSHHDLSHQTLSSCVKIK